MLMRVARDIKLIFRRPPRQQYAALCYRTNTSRELEVMLLTSRETGRWVIPKGWPMAGKLSHEVAAQEALEEAGMIGAIAAEPLGTFSYLKKLKNGVCVALCVYMRSKSAPRQRRSRSVGNAVSNGFPLRKPPSASRRRDCAASSKPSLFERRLGCLCRRVQAAAISRATPESWG